MELDFDKNYISVTKTLHFNRSHPNIKRNYKWVLTFIIMQGTHTSVFVLLMYNIIYFGLKANDFNKTCSDGVLAVMYLVTSFEYLILLIQQDPINEVINDIKRDYKETIKMTKEEKEIVYKYVKISQWVCKQWVMVGISGNLVFIAESIILMCYYYYINDFKLIAMYDLIYPEIIESNKDKIPVFLFTYFLIIFFGFYGASLYTGFVPLGPIFILHACAQLDLVKMRIDDLFVDKDNEQVRRNLKYIIQRIQYIDGRLPGSMMALHLVKNFRYVDRVKDCFKVCFEITLKATTIMLPIACYQIIAAAKKGEVNLNFLIFIVGAILISSAPCYYSDLLMEKGESVRLALYSCGWEQHYDRRTRTTQQLMLQHALRPIALKTIFRTLCLNALTDVSLPSKLPQGKSVRLALYSCGWEQHYDRRTRTTQQPMLQHALRPIALQTIFRTLCLNALTDVSLPSKLPQGKSVRLALYSCGWEQHYDRRTRTTQQPMLQHALRPIALQTIFRTLCLDALTDLFQQSYALFNLMCAAWE